MDDCISRQTVLRCIKESREDIDWGQSEDGDAFLHYSAALYRTVASKECVPAADVVPVVRCRECKHYEWTGNRVPEERTWFCYLLGREMGNDEYCSRGERRNES